MSAARDFANRRQPAAPPQLPSPLRFRAGLVMVLIIALAVLLSACGRPQRPKAPEKLEPPPRPQPKTTQPYEAPGIRALTPPRPSTKNFAQLIFDIEHPCFTRGKIHRAREVLFADFRHSDEMVWMKSLNRAFFKLKANCADNDFLIVVLSTIQMESGVNVDPKIANRDLGQMFTVRLQQFKENNALLGRIVSMSGLDTDLANKLEADTKSRIVITEGDLLRYFHNNLKPWMVDYFQNKFHLPEAVARRVVDAGLPNPVKTIGPMQVNVGKAYRNALKRGEHVDSRDEMQARLLDPGTAMYRGILEGIYMLLRPYNFYRKTLNGQQAARFASADFNGGEFSSRNAAFQERVAILSGRNIQLDGDLLAYEDGEPSRATSNTEAAVNAILDLDVEEIRRDLLLEKGADFWESETSRRICGRYYALNFKLCSVGRLPVGASNELAALKHGRPMTTAYYANKFLRFYTKNSRYFASLGADDLSRDTLAKLQRNGDPNPH